MQGRGLGEGGRRGRVKGRQRRKVRERERVGSEEVRERGSKVGED